MIKGSDKLCGNCRKALGYQRKDRGCHTAILAECSRCHEIKPILPNRHWIPTQQEGK